MDLTVLVPTFNERGNVAELVRRLDDALVGRDAEILFVDDSSDGTEVEVARVAHAAALPVRLLHREPERRTGGLAGAVVAGMAAARGTYVVVMDGDLQHPPELVPLLRDTADGGTGDVVDTAGGPGIDGTGGQPRRPVSNRTTDDAGPGVDMVVASRYAGSGNSSGLSSSWRHVVSGGSTLLARSCFPRRVGRVCTDPMTGFFCVRRDAVQLDKLRPRGFKILLEILTRHELTVAEVPFAFGARHEGESKASWANGMQFVYQMAALRMGRMSRFAAVGALGTVTNLVVMALLMRWTGLHYLPAAVIATEVAIGQNFLLQERFVFSDLRDGRHGWWKRALHSLLYNNADTIVRLPLLALMVEALGVSSLLGQAITLGGAFLARFFFVTTVVYRPTEDAEPDAAPDVLEIAPLVGVSANHPPQAAE